MGVEFAKYPQQGTYVGIRVCVCFNYDTATAVLGTVVRDDLEKPHRIIIKLDDDRYVLGSECQYRPVPKEQPNGR